MQDLPGLRAYPKHLDGDLPSSPIKDPKNACSKVKEQENSRPWPEPDKKVETSKRKRDTRSSPLSPHNQNEYNPLDRWLDEPGLDGPYHTIESNVPTKNISHVNDATKEQT